MSLLIGFLTFIMVMNCLFLILLILIQLPKKEAGAGIAFGGAATDALFGAGSGNALTKVTKYTATMFVGLAVLLSVMHMRYARQGSRRLEQELSKQAGSSISLPPTLSTNNFSTQVQPAAPSSNVNLATPPSAVTNLFLSTNAPAKAPAPAPAPVAPNPAK